MSNHMVIRIPNNGKHIWIWKEAFVTYFKAQSRRLANYTTEADKERYGLYGI
jgi:hypothetical protein